MNRCPIQDPAVCVGTEDCELCERKRARDLARRNGYAVRCEPIHDPAKWDPSLFVTPPSVMPKLRETRRG